MSFHDPFNPRGPFFQNEFIFHKEDRSRQRPQRPSAFVECCAECGQPLVFGSDSSVVSCPVCGTDYAPDWSKLR